MQEASTICVYHGSDRVFDVFDPGRCVTARHLYTTPEPGYAAKYGNNILCFQAVLGRHFELRAEQLYDGDYRERFRILRQMHAELGVCYGYDNFDDFVDTVTGGGMYQSWCSSKLQDAVLGYLFAEGFNSVSMSETYSWGESADVMVFSDPSLLTRVREHSGPSEAPYKENLC